MRKEKKDTKRKSTGLTGKRRGGSLPDGQGKTRRATSRHGDATDSLPGRLRSERLRLRLTWPDYAQLFDGDVSQATLWKIAHEKVTPHDLTVVVVNDALGRIARLKPSSKKGTSVDELVGQLAKLTGKRR
ncbi:MAG: hypothetical protein AB7K63_20625 [Vicinamibacterales bacterium]